MLKHRKLELQVEWLEKQNYKETLEILQLEKKLLLKHSKYTLDLVLEQNTDNLNELVNFMHIKHYKFKVCTNFLLICDDKNIVILLILR